jgi:phospholipase C
MPSSNLLPSIEHIVVLMLENRSFDSMLGFLYAEQGNLSPSGQAFEGLTGKESNPDANGKSVPVFKIKPTDKNAYFMPGADPGEGYAATNSELFGNVNAPTPPVATNKGFVKDFAYTLGWETKEKWSILPGTVAENIMGMFTPQMLPVLSTLARAYAVCDHWYSSAPTETMPNRAFANAATSQGHMDDKTKSFTVPSIFGLLGQNNLNWVIYGYDTEPLTIQNFPDTVKADASHSGLFKDFQAAAANGTLAPYSFLEPDWASTGNSQHPNYDVALGEQLIYDVYYALYKGKAWNQTLLIVTYDEHGGCYDHVPPPSGAVPPDDTPGEYGFDFKRFGIRVPAVLVSPLIAPGTVFRVPEGAMPFDHTSILKTIEKRWGLPALTARDAAAPDLGDVLTLAAPRTDDPLKGVKVPESSGKDPARGRPSHLQQVHAELVSRLPVQNKHRKKLPHISQLRTSADHKAYIQARTAAWKKSREVTAESSGQSAKDDATKKSASASSKAKKAKENTPSAPKNGKRKS